MNKRDFRAYLGTLSSSKTGRHFSAIVISDIVSRCATAERLLGEDLDSLLPVSSPVRWRRRYENVIPSHINGDYRSAVRKYLDFKLASGDA